MKKSLAYISTAVVLGIALMLTPIWLLPAEIRYGVAPDYSLSPLARLKELSEETDALFGIRVNQPTDAISVSLMVAISLVFALGASRYLKKRVPNNVAV